MSEQDEIGEKANALLGEAVLLRAQGRRREALAKCLESLKLLPEDAEAFNILGDLYAEIAMPQAALEAYRRARELDSSLASLELKIARAALQVEEAERQRRLAKELVEGRAPRPKKRNPAAAGLMSLFIPGFGQIQNGQPLKALILLGIWFGLLGSVITPLLDALTGKSSELLSFAGVLRLVLLIAVYVYAVSDAAVIATRPESEEEKLI